MKLEPEIVRDVLLFLEENLTYEDADSSNPHIRRSFSKSEIVDKLGFDLVSKNDIAYAIDQLLKEEYISSQNGVSRDNQGNIAYVRINDITWKGHELLNNIRDDSIWKEVKEKIKPFTSLGIGIISNVATSIIQEHLNKIIK